MKISKRKLTTFFLLGTLIMSIFSGCNTKETNTTQTNSVNDENVMNSIAEDSSKSNSDEYTDDVTYKNGKILTYKYDGGKLTIGTKDTGNSDGIYLNLNCSEAKEGNEIGYYLESSRVNLQYSSEGAGLNCNTGENTKYSNFVIVDHLYSDVIPAEYKDEENYGIKWADDRLEDGTNAGTKISIRAVNLITGDLITMCDAYIDYDKDKQTYKLTSVKSSDVSENNELSDESRENIVNASSNFIVEDLQVPESEIHKDQCIVDLHNVTYFPRFLDINNSKIIYYKDYTTCFNTYAVNIPVDKYGFVTVYFAPQSQLIGLTSPSEPGSDDLKLKMFAYDALNPYNEHTIIAPDGFLY